MGKNAALQTDAEARKYSIIIFAIFNNADNRCATMCRLASSSRTWPLWGIGGRVEVACKVDPVVEISSIIPMKFFDSMHNVAEKMEYIEYYRDSDTQPFVTSRPGITATFFLSGNWVAVCAAIADALDIYFSLVPRTELKSYLNSRGEYRDISPSVITGELRKLRKLPDHYEGYTFRYSSGSPAQVGDYGIWVHVRAPGMASPNQTQTLRLEFPLDTLSRFGEDVFIHLIKRIAQVLPIHCGTVGYGFAQILHNHDAERFVHGLLDRYLGFDPFDWGIGKSLLGYTHSAHWLTILGFDLLTALGGRERLKSTAPQAHLWSSERCVVIRASQVPAIGNVAEGAGDLGVLPSVARFLRPLRIKDTRRYNDDFDLQRWLARFDERSDTNWENS
jgi:hypothetical protein